jgi:hypothetical protein
MKIETWIPDIAAPRALRQAQDATSTFAQQYDKIAAVLDRAQVAERDFAAGRGSLLAMTTARATADIALSTAVAIASRLSQFASTLGNMSL